MAVERGNRCVTVTTQIDGRDEVFYTRKRLDTIFESLNYSVTSSNSCLTFMVFAKTNSVWRRYYQYNTINVQQKKFISERKRNGFEWHAQITPSKKDDVRRFGYTKGRGRVRPQIGPLVFFLANPIKFYINRKIKLRGRFWC